jgi:vWA-MoxR associated protein C-terminal domain
MPIPQEELNRIIYLLGSIATLGDAQNFYKDLIWSANLPKDWVTDILEKPGLSSSQIINWALAKGKNIKDERYYTLGSILNVFKEKTGHREEIAIFMVRNELCDVNLLPQELQSKINVPTIIEEKLEYPIISKTAQENLASILKQIDFRIVKKACRRSLPRFFHHRALSIKGIDEVFKLLLVEFQKRNDGKYRILEFAWRLREDYQIQSQQIHLKLDDWFARYSFQSPPIDRKDSKDIPQPRLFIQVEPKDIGITQFCVQAWLIPDRSWLISNVNSLKENYAELEYFYLNFSYLLSEYRQETHKSISPELSTKIEQISQSEDPEKFIRQLLFSKEELKEILGLFLNESLQILFYEQEEVNEEINLSKLTIEVFLPPELLCDLDLDRWPFYNIPEKIDLDAVGSSYRILIRSLERSTWLQNERNRRQNKTKMQAWKDKWALVHKNGFDRAISDEKIGVKLVQKSGRDERDEILKEIINDKCIPIALWTRFSDSEVDFESEWQKLVDTNSLHDLPESVRRLREAAQESGCQNHLGSNLVLLWDDPNSLLPPQGDFLKVGKSIKRIES